MAQLSKPCLRPLLCTLVVACLLAVQSSPPLHASALVTHDIRDEFGFEQPLTAMTIQTPPDWVVTGAVQWAGNPQCVFDRMKVHFMATAPDGKQWVEMIPGGAWAWNSNFQTFPQMAQQGVMGCESRPIIDIQGFVDTYLPLIRPGARILSSRLRPDVVDEVREMMGPTQLQPGQQQRIEAMEIRISYSAQGATVEELLIPVLMFLDQPVADPYGSMNARLTLAMAIGTMTTATVDGKADEAVLDRIGETIKPDPSYQQRLQQHFQQKTQLAVAASQRRLAAQRATMAAMRANRQASRSQVDTTGSDLLDIQMNTWINNSEMNDAGHANTVNMIQERRPWQTTTGATIYMPQEYQAVYQLPNQVYAGTNDPFFNPLQSVGEFGEQLQPLSGQ